VAQSLADAPTEVLIQALESDDLKMRAAATYYLGRRAEAGELEILPVLIELLVDPQIEISDVAVEHLRAVGEPAVLPLLTALCDHGRHPSIRGMAARGLGNIRDDRALKPMLKILQDRTDDTGVRFRCAFYLGRLGDVRAVEPLGRILTASDDSAEVRQAAAAGLEELKDQRAVPFLLVALGDESLHNFAWNTLARLVGIAEADRLSALAAGG